MASEVDICNMALSYLGTRNSITSLSDQNVEAELCNMHYAATRDALLAAHNWQFARKQFTLLDSTEDPVDDYAYVYQYPSDCLRIIRMLNPTTVSGTIYAECNSGERSNPLEIEFEVRYVGTSRVIVADYDDLKMLYVAQITQTGLFTPGFTKALAAALAAEIAVGVTRKLEIEKAARERAQAMLMAALRDDSQGQHQMQQKQASWHDDR